MAISRVAVALSQLHRLAEVKATWLVNSIRLRKVFGINQLGAWKAEGAISQIDEVVPDLGALPGPSPEAGPLEILRFPGRSLSSICN